MDTRKENEPPQSNGPLSSEFGTPYVDDSNPTVIDLGVSFPGDEEPSPSSSTARTVLPTEMAGVPYWNPREAGETLAGKIGNVEGEWIEWLGQEVPVATVETDDGPVLLRVVATRLRNAWSKSRPRPAAGDEIVLRFEGTEVNEATGHEFELYDLHVTLDEDPLKAKEFLQDALATGPRVVSHLYREAEELRLSPNSLRSVRKSLGVETMARIPGKGEIGWWGMPGSWPAGSSKK